MQGNEKQEVQPVEMATPFITMEEWRIWVALDGQLGPEEEQRANDIMDARIATEEASKEK